MGRDEKSLRERGNTGQFSLFKTAVVVLFVHQLCVKYSHYLFELQLKSFGAKLKERNNFFRKTSKTDSHEMKEVLYSNLVQANLVRVSTQKYRITTFGLFLNMVIETFSHFQRDQQALKETIEKADEMIKSLDDCIHELETGMSTLRE